MHMNIICVDGLCVHISPNEVEIKDNAFVINDLRFAYTDKHKIYHDISVPFDWEPHKYFYSEEYGWRLNPQWTDRYVQCVKNTEIKLIHLCKMLYDNNLISDDQMRRINDE